MPRLQPYRRHIPDSYIVNVYYCQQTNQSYACQHDQWLVKALRARAIE